MGVKYAPLYASLNTMANRLGDNARLALFDAFRAFCFEGLYPDFFSVSDFPNINDMEREILDLSFMQIAPTIESTLKKIEGGKQGGRPRKERGGEAAKEEAKEP